MRFCSLRGGRGIKNLAEDLRRILISQLAAEQAALRGIRDRMPRLQMQTRILGIEDAAAWCSRHQATVEDLENYKRDILSQREKQLAVVARLESDVKSLKYAIRECAEFIAGNKQLSGKTEGAV